MIARDRPLSPHLQVYRPQITSMLSILHRITGVALGAGAAVLVWYFAALAASPEYFDYVRGVMGSVIGRLFLFGWTFALFYHLANGIRHMAWDAGLGFEIDQVSRSGLAALGVAVGLTILAWVVGYNLV